MKIQSGKDPHDVILRPVLSEKAYDGLPDKRYTFEVEKTANKIEIKQALEAIFPIQIAKVNTTRTLGKIKRQGKYSGRTPEVKKAYITLKPESKTIEFFDGMAQ
ncbi:MAG: 50S ribosomal protein L23 [Oscillospiraceae bacterium]|jgi:large subunit ribosomal protein L23|nr:50S ribosomal protein L23 [Oscillospiraceae bacterium]